MVHEQLQSFSVTLRNIGFSCPVNMHAFLTVDVENVHTVTYMKEETLFSYSRNLSTAVYESMKCSSSWSAAYFTSASYYYPVPPHSVPLADAPTFHPLKPAIRITDTQRALMRRWAMDHNKCARQRTVRQENKKYRACTIPLSMYLPSEEAKGDEVPFAEPEIDSAVARSQAEDEEETEAVGNDAASDVSFDHVSEYDVDCDSEVGHGEDEKR